MAPSSLTARLAWTQPPLSGDLAEALFDVAPVDVIEGSVEPVAEVLVKGAAVAGDRAVPAPGSDCEIVLKAWRRVGMARLRARSASGSRPGRPGRGFPGRGGAPGRG